ncbi:C39 family peptidase [Patescibacteria group bacterium]|nr:C39 family peptidase [Patescibacteria group bacterium]
MVKLVFLLLISIGLLAFFYLNQSRLPTSPVQQAVSPTSTPVKSQPTPTSKPLPQTKLLKSDYQIFQTFNNCGPAALSMALYYFGIYKSQAELGADLRPYQNPQGNNDDKSVSLDELAQEAEKFGLIAYHRPAGNLNLLKQFIAQGLPVITLTLLKADDDIGHYRVVKGYDDQTAQIIQDDSMQGANIHFSYQDFNQLWQQYNYEYLVLAPKNQQATLERILGNNLDEKTAWEEAVKISQNQLKTDPENVTARFNLSVALYHVGDYQGSIDQFSKAQNKLPFRTLWYQIEPIQAYYQLGDYQQVFVLTDQILGGGNRAFSELYLLRGQIYLHQGNTTAAKEEFSKAVFYNIHSKAA